MRTYSTAGLLAIDYVQVGIKCDGKTKCSHVKATSINTHCSCSLCARVYCPAIHCVTNTPNTYFFLVAPYSDFHCFIHRGFEESCCPSFTSIRFSTTLASLKVVSVLLFDLDWGIIYQYVNASLRFALLPCPGWCILFCLTSPVDHSLCSHCRTVMCFFQTTEDNGPWPPALKSGT